ncbi:hypothetical protein [Lacrimispora amygdalina]|uniref:hypothetical protein n=1 Tax=Lacrimispora amygdalina TaxID=253257 RepID=UPI000BE30769|nr:hypothetical protein [Lacrimispora amygdalina]
MISSLQITTPAKKCIFRCPFCISLGHSHNNIFRNLYEENFDEWRLKLIDVLISHPEIETCVITGTNEPMQSPDFISAAVSIIKDLRPDIRTEIQTRFYKRHAIFKDLDIACYSVSRYEDIIKIEESALTNRLVIILTDSFSGKTINDILEEIKGKNITQVTLKKLHTSNGVNPKMDSWIMQHSIAEDTYYHLKNEVANYDGPMSIRLDENCMDAGNRYLIFREDGNIYKNWEMTS